MMRPKKSMLLKSVKQLDGLDLLALFFAGLACLLVGRAPANYARSDPFLSLFVSQSLLDNQTVALDAYRDRIDPDLDSYALLEHEGRLYSIFPIGPSLVALPFVGIANVFDFDMTETMHNYRMQKVLMALIIGLVFLVLYRLARYQLPPSVALMLAAGVVYGSALIGTLGTALWNINFVVLFNVLVLWGLVHMRQAASRKIPALAGALGLLLFLSFISRPTAGIFLGLVIIYLYRYHRRAFWPTVIVLAVGLLGFALFSWLAFGRLLPSYYALSRMNRTTQLGYSLIGQLLSPSRGLLIFSPFIFLVLVGMVPTAKWWRDEPLFWLCMGWILLHICVAMRREQWWGGHVFGPRLLAEIVPPFTMMAFIIARIVRDHFRRRTFRLFVMILLVLGGIGIYINTYQGLYNYNTVLWNVDPDIDYHPGYAFNWRYAQFLANPESLAERAALHRQR